MGENLGLKKDFAYNIVKQVGNYGESFEKTVGQGSPPKKSKEATMLFGTMEDFNTHLLLDNRLKKTLP